MEVVSKTLRLSAKVQKGLDILDYGRSHKKETWGEGLTVLSKETAKLPLIKRKALAINKVLSEMPVAINDHEVLVGSAVHGNEEGTVEGATPFPEYATQEEKEAAVERLTGVRSVFGHFSPYYPRYLKLGLHGVRKMAEQKLDEVRRRGTEPEKEAWYESVIMCLDGLKYHVQRYRNLAARLASDETDLVRKRELQEIATVSQHLLEEAPQTFHEALQAVWFAHIAFHSSLNLAPFGRFDQYMWPYLKQDLESGAITIDQAQELIDCFWLKSNERLQEFRLNKTPVLDETKDVRASKGERANYVGLWSLFLGGKTSHDRVRLDGGTYTQFLQTMTLSGLTPEGLDGTNPLTYICLNAILRLRTPQPCLYVRLHEGSPPELYERVADCIRAGCVGPAIYNDEIIIPALQKWGIPVDHARDYTSDGCWETHVQGRTYFKYGLVSVAEALDRTLSPARWKEAKAPDLYIEALDPYRDSKDPDPYAFRSFDELMQAVKENLDKYVKGFIEVAESMRDDRLYNIAPLPLFSAFVEGPLEVGRDITQNGMEYTQHSPLLVGLSHAVDSLAAIRKLCFEDKAIKWSELLDAVRSNWQDREDLRQLVRTRAPAYGNDVDYVDNIAREIVEYFVESVWKHATKARSSIKFTPGIGTFELYTNLGRPIGAMADGRRAGEPLSTNASPSIGRTTSGQTAALNSHFRLPLGSLAAGAAIDINMESRADLLSRLEPLIKSFVERRGSIVSITVNDCQKLREAQKHPEKYRDLKVRVGGYQAYFVDLPPHHQDFQIKRCEQYA